MPTLANATIGTLYFVTLGGVEPKSVKVEVIERDNLDGIEFQLFGTRGEPRWVQAVADVVAADAAALKVILDKYQSLQGQTVTVVDDCGITTTNVLIKYVRIPPTYRGDPNPQAVELAVGGHEGTNATHLVAVELVMIDTNI